MSTDDLTARVRDHLAHADTLPHGLAIALVSELADEVDDLRAELTLTERQIHDPGGYFERVTQLEAERDAARAALERVRAIADSKDHRDDEGNHVDLNDDTRAYLTRALEGKP